jgi:chromosome segregation ATPase
MSKISDFLARKSSLAEQAPIFLPSEQEEASPPASAPEDEVTAGGGTRLGAENEALRSLVVEAARKVEDLDNLKLAFGRIIDPLQRTLQALEQEKAKNASLFSSLTESRTAVDGLRENLQQSEKTAASLSATNEKLQLDIEQLRQSVSGLESTRIELINETSLKNTQIAELESRLSAESIGRQALADEHRIVTDQAQSAAKRLGTLETEIVAARQKIALSDDEKHSLQNALDQTLSEVSRASRQLTDTNNALAAAQTRRAQLESSFAEAEGERMRLVAALDEANERHRSESSAQAMRLEALQSRAATAEKLLVEARANLTARADEIRSFERKLTDTTIARNAAEKKLAQIEGAQQTQERQIKDLEQARAALLERNTALGKNMRTRETELARAEEKIQSSNDLIARLEADIQASRARAEKRIEELNALLEHERMDRSVAEGALEATRKDNARLQRENSRLEASQRHGDDTLAGKRARSNIEPIVKG